MTMLLPRRKRSPKAIAASVDKKANELGSGTLCTTRTSDIPYIEN